MTAQDERAAVVAAEIRQAQLDAIKQADRSGWFPTIITLLVLWALQAEFGASAAFWFGIGGIVIAVMFLWETGRNIETEQRATERWAAEFLLREGGN